MKYHISQDIYSLNYTATLLGGLPNYYGHGKTVKWAVESLRLAVAGIRVKIGYKVLRFDTLVEALAYCEDEDDFEIFLNGVKI